MVRPHHLWCWIAAAVLELGDQLIVAQAVSPEHWCAGPGLIVDGTRCPVDDSQGACPPGCEAKTSGCGNACHDWATGIVVLASGTVLVVFCVGVLSPIISESSKEEEVDVEEFLDGVRGSMYNNPLTNQSSQDEEVQEDKTQDSVVDVGQLDWD
jgi:hypothetical protein